MPWVIATNKDLGFIINFLKKDEWLSVQILSLFINNKKQIEFPKQSKVITVIKKNNNTIDGIIAITSRGLVYPRFQINSIKLEDKEELIKIIAGVKVNIHGVIGITRDVTFMDSVIFRPIRQVNKYILLHIPNNNKIKLEDCSIVKKATIKNHQLLLPLELEYQKEEVIISEKDFNKKAISENFKQKLDNNDIYYILKNRLPVTKGGTTYKSLNYTLLGGIFTWKRLRNRGLSTALLIHLINSQLDKGYKCALFVREFNTAAIHLYNKLGFKNPIKYQINYYKR